MKYKTLKLNEEEIITLQNALTSHSAISSVKSSYDSLFETELFKTSQLLEVIKNTSWSDTENDKD